MILRHATPVRNLSPITDDGLLCSKSKGRLPVVWLHTPDKSGWAAMHTVSRHGGKIENVVVIEVRVPRSWLRKSRRGLWYSVKDIPPARIGDVIDFGGMATSPAGR